MSAQIAGTKWFIFIYHSAVCLTTVHSLFQSQFSTQCNLVATSSFNFQYPRFSLSFNSSLRLLSFLDINSISHFLSVLQSCVLENSSYARCDQSNYPSFFPLYVRYFSPSLLCKTSSFLTRSVQLIFPILLQHHILKLCRYFCSTFQRVQVSAPYNAVLKM